MTPLHCFDCNRTVEFIGMSPLGAVVIGHATGCKAMRVTPIAVICDPPEPTVIDESDLAPGMVVVAVDDTPRAVAFLCSPDVRLGAEDGALYPSRGCVPVLS